MIIKNKDQFLKKKLPLHIKLASGLSLLGAMGVAAPSMAQDIADNRVEEVLVSGQRQSIQSAQTIKRDAEVVVDSITAVDIGALPDRSVSEALQRVPGVQLQRTNENRDPARLASEGGAVFIRGLSWVRTELNGRDIYSASNGRSLGFEDVSADLMAGLDVYKSPSAELVEGGVGGTVNLRTRLPFDQNERLIAGSLDYNYADLYDEGFTSSNALFSDRWETGAGEFGVLLSASLAEIGNRTDSIQTGRYEPNTANGDDVYLPTGIGFRRVDWEQERNAFAGALQWAPNDEFTLTIQALRAEANPVDVERAVGINEPFGNNLSPGGGSYVYNDEGFAESGTINNAAISYNTRFGERESATGDHSISFKYTPGDSWAFSGDLQYVESRADITSMTAFSQMRSVVLGEDGNPVPVLDGNGNTIPDVNGDPIPALNPHSGVNAQFDLTGTPSIVVTNPAKQALQSEYYWAAAMDHIEDNNAESIAGRLDAEYTFESSDFMRSIRFGVRATDKDTITRQSGWNWSLLSQQFWGGATPPQPAFLDQYATDQSELYPFDDFFRGDIAAPAVGWFPTESLVSNRERAYTYLADTQKAGWGWAPLQAPGAYDLNPQGDNVSAGINEQNEKTEAIYAMLRFGDDAGEILNIPFDGNIGVRVVRTKTTAIGRSGAGGVGDGCAVSTSEDCVGATEFVTAFNAQFGDYATYTNDYTNVLPSLNIRFMLNDDLQLRLGASRAMVRPSFSQTRPYTNLSFSFVADEFDPNMSTEGDGVAGSPDLNPTIADQLDASIEWYFADTGSLTFAAFYKDIKDYIQLETRIDNFTYGDRSYDFEVTRQVNSSEGKLQGFELAYQQFFDTLPGPLSGLGIQANYTYIDNSGGANTAINIYDPEQQAGASNDALPIEGMSKTSYNLALMYEKYDVSARLAYNWRERYLLTTSAANINRPVWSDDYGQLDGSVFYTVNDNLKVGVQATNLLNSQTHLEVGDTRLTGDYSWTDTDRRIAFVVRGQF